MKRNIAFLIIIALGLIALSRLSFFSGIGAVGDRFFHPVQVAFYAAGRSFTSSFQTIFQINNLRDKNAELSEKLALLEAENGKLKKLADENNLLKDQLKINTEQKIEVRSAQVLGYSPTASRALLMVDKGRNDGIKVGDIALVKDIILGQITSVEDKTSLIRLLSDPESKVLGETQGKAKGVLVGDFGSRVKLTKVLLEETLTEGDLVFTTGEENFPKGLVVGKITKVKRNEAELFQEADIDRLLDTQKLDLIFIRRL